LPLFMHIVSPFWPRPGRLVSDLPPLFSEAHPSSRFTFFALFHLLKPPTQPYGVESIFYDPKHAPETTPTFTPPPSHPKPALFFFFFYIFFLVLAPIYLRRSGSAPRRPAYLFHRVSGVTLMPLFRILGPVLPIPLYFWRARTFPQVGVGNLLTTRTNKLWSCAGNLFRFFPDCVGVWVFLSLCFFGAPGLFFLHSPSP